MLAGPLGSTLLVVCAPFLGATVGEGDAAKLQVAAYAALQRGDGRSALASFIELSSCATDALEDLARLRRLELDAAPDDERARTLAADALARTGDWPGALRVVRPSPASAIGDPLRCELAGTLCAISGEYREALACFERETELGECAPSCARAITARLAGAQGDGVRPATSGVPSESQPVGLNLAGAVAFSNGDDATASRDWQRAIASAPSFRAPLANLRALQRVRTSQQDARIEELAELARVEAEHGIESSELSYDPDSAEPQPGDFGIRTGSFRVPHGWTYWGAMHAGALAFDSIELQRRSDGGTRIVPLNWSSDPFLADVTPLDLLLDPERAKRGELNVNWYRPLESDVAVRWQERPTTLRRLPLAAKLAVLRRAREADLARLGSSSGAYRLLGTGGLSNQCIDSILTPLDLALRAEGITVVDERGEPSSLRARIDVLGTANPMSWPVRGAGSILAPVKRIALGALLSGGGSGSDERVRCVPGAWCEVRRDGWAEPVSILRAGSRGADNLVDELARKASDLDLPAGSTIVLGATAFEPGAMELVENLERRGFAVVIVDVGGMSDVEALLRIADCAREKGTSIGALLEGDASPSGASRSTQALLRIAREQAMRTIPRPLRAGGSSRSASAPASSAAPAGDRNPSAFQTDRSSDPDSPVVGVDDQRGPYVIVEVAGRRRVIWLPRSIFELLSGKRVTVSVRTVANLTVIVIHADGVPAWEIHVDGSGRVVHRGPPTARSAQPSPSDSTIPRRSGEAERGGVATVGDHELELVAGESSGPAFLVGRRDTPAADEESLEPWTPFLLFPTRP